MFLIISCLVSLFLTTLNLKPILEALDFFPGVDFLIVFFFFWPTPFLWNVVHCNSQFQEMVQNSSCFFFYSRKQSRWWTLDFQGEILFLKAGTFGDMTQAGSFWGELNLQKSFWHYILEFHRQIDSQTDLPIFFWFYCIQLVLHFFLTKITTPQLFSKNTSTKNGDKFSKSLNKKWCFPTFPLKFP